MSKKVVGLFFGGVSPEHEVSISSARGVLNAIDRRMFSVREYFIDKKGKFWTGHSLIEKLSAGKRPTATPMNMSMLVNRIDVAFPVLHGEGGEDGSIQGFFKTLGIPFVGADILGSALCLDKSLFNQVMVAHGIVKPRFLVIDSQYDSPEQISRTLKQVEKMRLPLFVKPSRAGSSVGITKVLALQQLSTALEVAKKFDGKIVIEEAVVACKEIEVSVLGNGVNSIEVSLPGRVIPAAAFYDYDDKYKDNKTKFEVPAKLPKSVISKIQSIAREAYCLSQCIGLARVDFLLDAKNRIFLNEINTMPGFTPISMYPRLWEASGLSYDRLITRLIMQALHST